jgi:polysaccharide chain length determinant protein (PEP-CTERM system associated)
MPWDPSSQIPEEPLVRRALTILRRRAFVAFVAMVAVLTSAVAFSRYLPDLYQASAIVLVERQLAEAFVRPAATGELESRLHVIKQEVLSRARLTDLISRFDLYPALRARGDMDGALDQVRRDIQIELTGPEQLSGRSKTVAFNLAFTGTSRGTVAEVTNAIADFYVAQNSEMRADEAKRAAQFLAAQVEDAKARLDSNEKQVRTYTDQHVGELPQQVSVNLAALDRLNTQLRLNGERQMRLLDQRERMLETPAPTPVTPVATAVSPSDARLDKLKRDLAALEGFPDRHPDVRRLKDEIAAVEEAGPGPRVTPVVETARVARPDQTAAIRARTIESLDAEYESLRSEEATIRQTVGTVERRLEGVPYRQNEFSALSRDHQATREQYESLVKRYEEAQLAQSMEKEQQGERFRILESAVPPMGPSAPNRARVLIMGLFLAVLAAGLAVLVVEQFDTSFHSIDDLRRFTRVPVLVAIPRTASWPPNGRLRAAVVTASVLAGFVLVGTLSAYVARDNEPLVRLLVRGG